MTRVNRPGILDQEFQVGLKTSAVTICNYSFGNMGCDIFSWVEVYNPEAKRWSAVRDSFPGDAATAKIRGVEVMSSPFEDRSYGLFGFLAGVRNYARCEALDLPRGLPLDCDVSGGIAVLNELEVVEDLHIHDGINSSTAFIPIRGFSYRNSSRSITPRCFGIEGSGKELMAQLWQGREKVSTRATATC